MNHGHCTDRKNFERIPYSYFEVLKKSGELAIRTSSIDKKHNQRLSFAKQQIFTYQQSCEASYPKAFLQTLV